MKKIELSLKSAIGICSIGLLFALARPSAGTESGKKDPGVLSFDQGSGIDQVIADLTRNAKEKRLGLSPLRLPGELPSFVGGPAVTTPPWYFGPWLPKINDHPSLENARQYPLLLEKLTPETRRPLEVEWSNLQSEGNQLRAAASELEPEDRRLYDDYVWLDGEKKFIDNESIEIEADRARYRSRCWVDNPPSDCEGERLRLNERIKRFNLRVETYNSRLKDWTPRREKIGAQGKALDGGIKIWGGKLDSFSRKAEKALEEGGVTRVRVQAQTGTTVLASASLAKLGHVTVYEGFQLLGEVYEKLPQRERDNRINAFAGAKEFMTRCAGAGGCRAPIEKPNYNDPAQIPWGPRIDISVFSGTAFVYTPAAR